MPNANSLHRRLDRLGDDGAMSIAEALGHAQIAHKARQAAWTGAGHPGAPPHEQLPAPPGPNASHAERELWCKIAQGSARVIYGKDPAGSPFATVQATYAWTMTRCWLRSTATRSMPAEPSMTTNQTATFEGKAARSLLGGTFQGA